MNNKKVSIIFLMLFFVLNLVSISLAEYGPGDPDAPPPETTVKETEDPNATGPVVAEYYNYDKPKDLAPGSTSGDVNFNYIGKGLYYDGDDFYFFLDTGIMATNYMYNYEGDRFFFGENGRMVKDEMVEFDSDIYYFDANGAMLRNSWFTVEEYDEYEKTSTFTTYYFGRTGRAYRAVGDQGVVLKEIEGDKYGFNSDGELLKGFVDAGGSELDPQEEYAYIECLYFFDPDDEYAAYSGWLTYESTLLTEEYSDYEEINLYFDPKTHRKVKSANNERYLNRTIDEQRYIFDSNGVRVRSWTGDAKSQNSRIRYFDDIEGEGYLTKGWFQAIPSENSILQENIDYNSGSEEMWFFASRNGSILRKCIRKVGQYMYAFDDDGVMQSDRLVVVENGEYKKSYDPNEMTFKEMVYGASEGGILNDGEKWMYFTGLGENESLEGSMCKTGSLVDIDLKNDEIKFLCNNGGGYSNKVVTEVVQRGGRYIQNGVVLAPDKDNNKYGVIRESATELIDIAHFKNWKGEDLGDKSGLKYWLVNTQGKKVTGHNVCYKDSNGYYIYLGENGVYLGYYMVQGKYVNGKWRYRDFDDRKVWHDTFPPTEYQIDDKDLFINFDSLDNSLSDYIYDSP